LIYAGRFGAYSPYAGTNREGEQWTAGLVSSATGLSLATLALAWRGLSEADAWMAHSGGGLGLLFGGLTEAFVRADVGRLPVAGMGYGAGLGWLGASAFAVHLRPSAARVLGVDLGVLMGGLGGAALSSPLLLDGPTAARQRAWLGITSGGAIVGAAIGWFASRPKVDSAKPKRRAEQHVPMPMLGLLGESRAGDRRAPVVGLLWSGPWR
jgi:hypothetical protein